MASLGLSNGNLFIFITVNHILIVGDVTHPSSYNMASYLVVIFLKSNYISL